MSQENATSNARLIAQPGDWIRVQRGGHLVIAIVEYLQPHKWSASTIEAVTDTAGVVQFTEILELRRKGKSDV